MNHGIDVSHDFKSKMAKNTKITMWTFIFSNPFSVALSQKHTCFSYSFISNEYISAAEIDIVVAVANRSNQFHISE